jgi:hypothetical protein
MEEEKLEACCVFSLFFAFSLSSSSGPCFPTPFSCCLAKREEDCGEGLGGKTMGRKERRREREERE